MKKILLIALISFAFCSSAFSNFFSQRFLEVKAGTSFGVSNNTIIGNDVFKKDLVIDLRKLADNCPDEGFNIRVDENTLVAAQINILNFHLGVTAGTDIYERLTVGKELFDFLGYGNSLGESFKIDFNNTSDAFAYLQFNLGFPVGKLKFDFRPAVFTPLFIIKGSGGSATFTNTSDGKMKGVIDINMDVFSPYDVKIENGSIVVDKESLKESVLSCYGIDLGGSVRIPYYDYFNIDAVYQIPIVPAKIGNKSTVKGSYEFEMSVTDMENAEFTSNDVDIIYDESADFSINRPLKLGLYLDKVFEGGYFHFRGGAGLGVRQPFSDYAIWYPEYYLGCTVNLIDMFKLTLSTEYKDQVFIHQLGTSLNIRFCEVDFGLSLQSANFKKSLEVAGVGAYVYVICGF